MAWRGKQGLALRSRRHPHARAFPSELLPIGTDPGRGLVKRDGGRKEWDGSAARTTDVHLVGVLELASQIPRLASHIP